MEQVVFVSSERNAFGALFIQTPESERVEEGLLEFGELLKLPTTTLLVAGKFIILIPVLVNAFGAGHIAALDAFYGIRNDTTAEHASKVADNVVVETTTIHVVHDIKQNGFLYWDFNVSHLIYN